MKWFVCVVMCLSVLETVRSGKKYFLTYLTTLQSYERAFLFENLDSRWNQMITL